MSQEVIMDYINAKQVADLLNYKESYIRWLVNTKSIPNIKIRGKLLFLKNDILEWFDKSKCVRGNNNACS